MFHRTDKNAFIADIHRVGIMRVILLNAGTQCSLRTIAVHKSCIKLVYMYRVIFLAGLLCLTRAKRQHLVTFEFFVERKRIVNSDDTNSAMSW